jgi:hypothetical protein
MKRNKVLAGFFCAALVVSPVVAQDWDDAAFDDLLGDLIGDTEEEVVEADEDVTLETTEDEAIDVDVAEDDADVDVDVAEDDVDVDEADADDVASEDEATAEAEDALEATVDETAVTLSDEEKSLARFNPVLNVRNIKMTNAAASIKVTTPKGVTTEASTFKAYPHGSTFEATDGVSFRVLFAPASYVVVSGPAKFTLSISGNNRKAVIDAAYGDMNIRISKAVKPDQVVLKTPIGNFESLVGIFNLRVDAEDEGCDGCENCGNVIFRTATGSARFVGSNYSAPELLDNNAFRSVTSKRVARRLGNAFDEEVYGRVGVFNLSVATRAGGEDKLVQILPSAKLRISREKPAGSENWVVTVMGFHSDGSIKSYFSYVENREDPLYWIPEQIKTPEELEALEASEEEVAEEDASEEEEDYSEEYPEEMGDFDDELL